MIIIPGRDSIKFGKVIPPSSLDDLWQTEIIILASSVVWDEKHKKWEIKLMEETKRMIEEL